MPPGITPAATLANMGAWGPGIFSDDLACDVRDEFRDLIGDGLTSEEAAERIFSAYPSLADDPDEGAVVLVALAVTEWKIGRLLDAVRDQAVEVIDKGADLHRWIDNTGLLQRREQALARAKAQLLSPQPSPVRIRKPQRSSTPFVAGDVVLYIHDSGTSFVFWVVGNKTDKGGTYSYVELLDIEPSKVIARPKRVTKAPKMVAHLRGEDPTEYMLLGCQRMPEDRFRILGRVERPVGRPRPRTIAMAFVNPPPRQTRIAKASLDRRLDSYLGG